MKTNQTDREILEFMLLLMDECTNLINFDKPLDNTMIHILSAQDDAYILRDGAYDFPSIWPGSQRLSSYKLNFNLKFGFYKAVGSSFCNKAMWLHSYLNWLSIGASM